MANDQERKQNPAESDITKSQSQQQPQTETRQQRETGEQAGQFKTGQQGRQELAQDQGGSPDEGLQGDTLAQQRTDIEGAARETPDRGETESGFVGSKGEKDTSSEMVDKQRFDKDGQGAPEGE